MIHKQFAATCYQRSLEASIKDASRNKKTAIILMDGSKDVNGNMNAATEAELSGVDTSEIESFTLNHSAAATTAVTPEDNNDNHDAAAAAVQVDGNDDM